MKVWFFSLESNRKNTIYIFHLQWGITFTRIQLRVNTISSAVSAVFQINEANFQVNEANDKTAVMQRKLFINEEIL